MIDRELVSSESSSSQAEGFEQGPLLIQVATPIGNLGDLSPRAATVLSSADLWIVEDTRVSGKLQTILGVKKPMLVCNEHTNDFKLQKIVDELSNGKVGALLTDAGSPGISDPGAILCDLCHENGIPVDAVPGPSAPIMALMLSGFFAQRFAFLGFLGRKPGDIRKELLPFADSPYTLVLFESPHRFATLLQVASEVLGPRRFAVCREMTKQHQQVFREKLPNIPSEAQIPHKGEFTVVIEGRRKRLAETSEAENSDESNGIGPQSEHVRAKHGKKPISKRGADREQRVSASKSGKKR